MDKKNGGRLRVAVVVGTRPEAIKIAPVIKRLQKRADVFETFILATAQHRELLDQVLSVFHIKPDVDLNLMDSRQGLADLTGRILENMSRTLPGICPHILLVQGDTTTTLASALAAFYLQIPIGHIEAGLRTHHPYRPFPEEMNRRLTTAMADLHFAPTPLAKEKLLQEGVSPDRIAVTGNTVVDALQHVIQIPFSFETSELKDVDLRHHRLVLVTSHRRESWGTDLQHICEAVKELVERHPDILVVYPVHPNPVVKETTEKVLAGKARIHLVKPLEYVAFVHLLKKADLILTDSGGLQEETPTLGKPLLLLRNVTERPEGIRSGLTKVVGTDRQAIVREAGLFLGETEARRQTNNGKNPYGDGRAAERIVDALLRWSEGETPLLPPGEEFAPTPEQDQSP